MMSGEMADVIQTNRDDSKLPTRIFNHSAGEFAEQFNRLPFAVSHNLGNHPLFELPRLIELAKTLWTLAGSKVLFQDGDAAFENRWLEKCWDAQRTPKGVLRSYRKQALNRVRSEYFIERSR